MQQQQSSAKLTPERLTDLVARARANDQQAVSDLYTESYSEVYWSVYSTIKDEALAQDVLQDAYLKAFRNLDQLENPVSFVPWVRRIALNRATDLLRRRQPLPFSQLEDEEGRMPEFRDDNPAVDPEITLDREETARLVRGILDSLSAGERAAVSLYYYEQLPVREIAERLGSTENSIKVQLHNGRAKIKRRVEDYEKQGVKLYGMAPMAFFLFLLRQVRDSGSAAAAGLSDAARIPSKPSAGSGAVRGAGSPAGTGAALPAAAKTGFAAFVAAHKAAVIAAIVGVFVLAGGIVTAAVLSGRNGSASGRNLQAVGGQQPGAVWSADAGILEQQSDAPASGYVFADEYPDGTVLLYEEYTNNSSDTPAGCCYYIYDSEQRLVQTVSYHLSAGVPDRCTGYHNYFYADDAHPALISSEEILTFSEDGSASKSESIDNTYDADGKLIHRWVSEEWAGSDNYTFDTYEYSYDSAGRLESEEFSYLHMDNPHLTTYSYEGDRLVSSRFMPGSLVGTPRQTTYEYDENGNCVTELVQFYSNSRGLEDGEKTVRTFDEAGRVLSELHYESEDSRWIHDKTKDRRWSYDSLGHVVHYSYKRDEYNTRRVRCFYGDPADDSRHQTLLWIRSSDEILPDPTAPFADYAAVVRDRESRYGCGVRGETLGLENGCQYYGVAIIRLLDLDGDGSDELLLGYNANGQSCFRAEVWAMRGGVPTLQYQGGTLITFLGDVLELDEINGQLCLAIGTNNDMDTMEFLALTADGMQPAHKAYYTFSSEGIVYYIDDEQVSSAAYSETLTLWRDNGTVYPFSGNYGSIEEEEAALDEVLRASLNARLQLGLAPLAGQAD